MERRGGGLPSPSGGGGAISSSQPISYRMGNAKSSCYGSIHTLFLIQQILPPAFSLLYPKKIFMKGKYV